MTEITVQRLQVQLVGCEECGSPIPQGVYLRGQLVPVARSDKRFCSPLCRVQAHRKKKP